MFYFLSVPTPPEIIRTGIKDLQVLQPKSIKAVIGSTVLTISGNNVSISCDVTGFPTPSVEWTKDGVSFGTEDSILTLSSVNVDDTGLYSCTATSPLGPFDSQSTNLTVIGMCSTHFTKRLTVTRFNKTYTFKMNRIIDVKIQRSYLTMK